MARPQGTASDNPADVSVVESSHSSDLHFDEPDESEGPARLPAEGVDGSAGHGTPAATAPGGGPDVSMLTGTRSPLFPSIPKTINQATLVDFMSLWTLLQRRMDQPSVPETSTSPAVQSSVPAPRHDSTNRRSATPAKTPERRPKSPERFLHTPQSSISSLVRRARAPERQARTSVRQARTSVRQGKSHSESRESRSRSHSLDPRQWSLLHEMSLQSTSLQRWTRMPREPFLMMRKMRVTVRRSLQRNIRSSDKLWLHQRDRTKSTPLRQSKRPGPLCWTWVIRSLVVGPAVSPRDDGFYGMYSARA